MKTREIRYRKSRRENFLEVPPRSGSSSQDLLIREWKKIESYSERVRGLDLFTKFPGGSGVRYVPAMWVTRVWSLGPKDPLEKGMVTHSSILGWRIQWTEKPWGQRVGHDRKTNSFTKWNNFGDDKFKVLVSNSVWMGLDGKDTADDEVKELKALVKDRSPMGMWKSWDDGGT